MNKENNKLIILASLLFVAVLVVRVVPLLVDSYKQIADEIALLEQRIGRYQNLQGDYSRLVEIEMQKTEEVPLLESRAFAGSTTSLVGSNVQRKLRQAIAAANVTVLEMKVSEYSKIDDWLVVSQEMTFTIAQVDMIMLLSLLAESMPKLHLTEFSINHSRRQYTGSLTVIAFSRIEESEGQG